MTLSKAFDMMIKVSEIEREKSLSIYEVLTSANKRTTVWIGQHWRDRAQHAYEPIIYIITIEYKRTVPPSSSSQVRKNLELKLYFSFNRINFHFHSKSKDDRLSICDVCIKYIKDAKSFWVTQPRTFALCVMISRERLRLRRRISNQQKLIICFSSSAMKKNHAS